MKKYMGLLGVLFCFAGQGQMQNKFQDINDIVQETLRAVSIKKGQQIDTAYYRTLFLPTATFTVVGKENNEYAHETMSLDDFLATLTDEYYSKGYFEQSTGQIIEEFNGMAQVIQSFEGLDSDNMVGKGVNSYQLIYSDGRWWIANMVWAMSYDNGQDIPAKYLVKK